MGHLMQLSQARRQHASQSLRHPLGICAPHEQQDQLSLCSRRAVSNVADEALHIINIEVHKEHVNTAKATKVAVVKLSSSPSMWSAQIQSDSPSIPSRP